MIKEKVGALIFDVPRTLWAFRPSSLSKYEYPWIYIRNRNERLIADEKGPGVKCDWQWTSDLYLPKVFPLFGKWLYHIVFQNFPIRFSENLTINELDKLPQVSFLIGHRGMERLPLLMLTLKSIAAQKDCLVECIVVEQDIKQRVREHLPEWVRYIHSPPLEEDMPYSRARAFNVAADAARSECLVFHDNDFLVPADYAKYMLKYHQQDYLFINLKRFIFYLTHTHTCNFLEKKNFQNNIAPASIMQNAESGGSFGADKKAFLDIGGFDERFIGWGGEDNELWERAQTKKIYPFGFLPFIHLWHASPPEKEQNRQAGKIGLYWELSKIPPDTRIKILRKRNRG